MTENAYAFRPAKTGDISELAALWNEGWHDGHADFVPEALLEFRRLDAFRQRLAAMQGEIVLACSQDTILGFYVLRGHEVYQFFVARQARGTGVAAALMTHALRALKASGKKQAMLDVVPENQRAVSFYEKLGWWPDGLMEIELETLDQPFPLTCLIMRHDL